MTYYDLLEVTENASEEVIKAAYKTQATKYHPDNKKTGDEHKMQMLNIAYDVLSDPEKRRQYDQGLHKDDDQKAKEKRDEKDESDVKRQSSEAEGAQAKESQTSENSDTKKASNSSTSFENKNVKKTSDANQTTESKIANDYTREIHFQKKLGFFFRFPVLFFLACIGFPFSLISLVFLFIRHMKLKNDQDYIDREKKMKRTKFYAVILILVMILVAGCSNLESTSEDKKETQETVSENTSDSEEDVKEEKVEKPAEAEKEEAKQNETVTEDEEVTDSQEEMTEAEKAADEESEELEDIEPEDEVVVDDAECIADGLYNTYYPTYIALQYDENMLLNKSKKMKLYIDGEFVVEMVQGDEKVYGIMLSEGKHTMKIKSGWFESEKIDFEVGKYEFYDLQMDNLFYMKMGYKFGDPKIMEFYGTNIPAEDQDVIDTNADVGANAVYAFLYDAYEPIGNFQEVFTIYGEKYGFEDTDMYKSIVDAGLLDE